MSSNYPYAEIAALKRSVQRLLEQFRLAQQKRFGASSESHDYQGELFNEAEVTVDESVELTADANASVPPKQRAKRKLLPKDLPREIWPILIYVLVKLIKTARQCH